MPLAELGGLGKEKASVGSPSDPSQPLPSSYPTPPCNGAARASSEENPPQSQAYVHRAGCAPNQGGPRALRFAACCLHSAGATPIRCRRMGRATGSHWIAGCLSSSRHLDAWGSAWESRGMGASRRGTPPLQATWFPTRAFNARATRASQPCTALTSHLGSSSSGHQLASG